MIIIYKRSTGEITGSVRDPNENEHSAYYETAEHGVLISDRENLANGEHYVDGGEIFERPAKPAQYHEWDWGSRQWYANIGAARNAVKAQWNQWRDRELKAGYVQDGLRYHSDETFMNELSLILKAYERGHFAENSLRTIRLMDNTNMRMGWSAVENLLLQIGLQREAIYAQSWYAKDAIEEMTSIEAILAAGPPAT